MPDKISAWKLEQAMSLLMRERERMLAADPELAEDEAALLKLFEAERSTRNAMEIIHALTRAAMLADEMAEAARRMRANLDARRARFVRREEAYRGMILAALQALGLPNMKQPDFSVSWRPGGAAVIITDDTLLPTEYVRIIRQPDKIALKEALANGEVIDGAELGNGADVLMIRTT